MRSLSTIFWPPQKGSHFGHVSPDEGQVVFSRAFLASIFAGGFSRFAFDYDPHLGSLVPWLVTPATAVAMVAWGRWYYRAVGARLPGRVLIVEDDPATAGILDRHCRRRGWDVDIAAGVRQGIEMLSRDPRAVILDLGLPDGSGIEVFRYLRLQAHPARLVVMTGSTDQATMAEVSAMRPTAVFSKPLHDFDKILVALGDPFE